MYGERVAAFTQTTSCHAVEKIRAASSLTRRVLYSVVLLASLAFFTYQFATLMEKYYRFPTNDAVSTVKPKHGVPFPTVIVTPYTGVGKVIAPGETERLVDNILANEGEQLANVSVGLFTASMFYYDTLNVGKAIEKEEFLVGIQNSHRRVPYNSITEVRQNTKSRVSYVYNFEYTDAKEPVRSLLPFPQAGLHLLIYSPALAAPGDLYDEEDGDAGKHGAKLQLTTGNVGKFVSGIDLQTGRAYTVGTRLKRSTRLNEPYGRCQSTKDKVEFYDSIWSRQLIRQNYTIQTCIELELQATLAESCLCLLGLYSIPEKYGHLTYCDDLLASKLEPRLECATRTMLSYPNDHDDDSEAICITPCYAEEYESSVSSSKWPTPDIEDDIIHRVIMSKQWEIRAKYEKNFHFFDNQVRPIVDPYIMHRFEKLTSADWEKDEEAVQLVANQIIRKGLIGQNFIQVNVYLNSETVEDHVQQPLYSAVDLIANTGGALGLAAGISWITLAEICELIIDLIRLCFIRKQVEPTEEK